MTFFVRNGTLVIFRWVRVIIFGTLSFVLVVTSARAQSPNAVNDLAARINRERISRGLIPYALNAQLSAAAQAHANDMVRTGKYSHTGSDGSTVFDRVGRTGFGAYSWGRRLGENWAWYHDPATAMKMWMGSTPHRNNILHTIYREFGIGITAAENGGFVYVVNFGAEPNVLPVFIQNGASETASRQVTIALSNEDYATSGDGAKTIGKATQVQISTSPIFLGAQWQPFTSKFAWTLPSGDGKKIIYVKYRDARGRTVTSSDSINADVSAAQEAPTAKPTVKPSATNTKPKSTATKTAAPLPTATRTAPSLPTATSTPDGITTPSSTGSLSITTAPTLAPEATGTATATPTSTDMLIPTPESTETPNMISVAIAPNQTLEGMIDSQEEIASPQVVPVGAPENNEGLVQGQVTPIALSILGMSVMLGVLAFVKWLEHRSKHE